MLFRKQREFSQLKEIGSTDLGPISQYVVQKQHEVSQLENAGTTDLGPISQYVFQETTGGFAAGKGWQY